LVDRNLFALCDRWSEACLAGLFVESKIDQIEILDDILLCLQAQLVRMLRLGFASAATPVRVTDDLGADEPFLDIRVNGAADSCAVVPFLMSQARFSGRRP